MTLPYGNYTASTLVIALNLMFSTATTVPSYPSHAITVAYSTLRNKLTYRNDTPGSITFTFGRGLTNVMGFLKNSVNVIPKYTASPDNLYYAPDSLFISTVTKLYLQTSMCDTSDFLQEILVCPSYPGASMIFYENHNYDVNSRAYTGAMHTSHSFRLLDSFGQIVDLNGIDLTFTLVIYKRNNVAELTSEDIRIRQLTDFTTHSKSSGTDKDDDIFMR
jgi:hypothetical protein